MLLLKETNGNENKNKKGSVVISETLLEAVGVIISFIIIVLVIQLVFQQQTAVTYESAYESVARDVSTAIDRASAAAGSIFIEQPLPKGFQLNLTIDYKIVLIEYGGHAVRKSTVGMTYTSPKSYTNPSILCIIKTANDRRVYVANGVCKCDLRDATCDPVCSVQSKCDPVCKSSVVDDVCNPYCVKVGDGICDPDCYRNVSDSVYDTDCVDPSNNPDSVCDPDSNNIKDGMCDKDCYTTYSNGNTGVCDPDCPPSDQVTEVDGVKYKQADGICYTGCINETATKPNKITLPKDGVCDLDCKDSANICDPDCPDSEACQNKCTKENEKADMYSCCEGLIACPSDNICKKLSDPMSCCGNGICEGRPGTTNGWGPGNKTRWETFYTCSQDCKNDPGTKIGCQSGGSFTKSVCYMNVFDAQGNFIGFTPVWRDNIFQLCNDEIQKFLDRRNWDIKELIKTWTDRVPESWAWDIARYQDACNRMQSASLTVSTNENYTNNAPRCCGIQGAACEDASYLSECNGVGFCIDHSTAVLSILRTLGVPAKNVYSVFDLTQNSAHAWLLLKCDPNEPENRKPVECEGNWGNWLSIDATNHYVVPLNSIQYTTICLMWNDQGLYAQNDGKIDATRGYAYDTNIPKTSSADPSLCMYNELCKQPFGIDCVVP